jgi:hypothetical protein
MVKVGIIVMFRSVVVVGDYNYLALCRKVDVLLCGMYRSSR